MQKPKPKNEAEALRREIEQIRKQTDKRVNEQVSMVLSTKERDLAKLEKEASHTQKKIDRLQDVKQALRDEVGDIE